MTTELPRHQTLALFRRGAALRWRTPLWTRTARDARSTGEPRVEEVELTDLDSGATRAVACDTVVFTRRLDPRPRAGRDGRARRWTRAPAARPWTRRCARSREGVFAAGNLLHGAETADVAALSGRHAAAARPATFGGGSAWPDARVPIECEPPLHWISPNVRGGRPPAAAAGALRPPLDRVRAAAADRGRPGRPHALGRPHRAGWCRAARRACRGLDRRRRSGGGPVSVRVVRRG